MSRPGGVHQLLETLSSSVVYVPGTDNVSTNRKLWNSYASEWDQKPAWLEKMANDVGEEPQLLGEEWSKGADLDFVLQKYILPYLTPSSKVLEIGPGGGRLTTRLLSTLGPAGMVVCADISDGMLATCRRAVEAYTASGLATCTNVQYLHIPAGTDAGMDLSVLDSIAPFDFILCFDVLVHVSSKPIWCYLSHMGLGGPAPGSESHGASPAHGSGASSKPWLQEGGKAFLSTSNLLAPLGWKRFTAQRGETVGGFCFSSPDMVDHMVAQAGLTHVIRSWPLQPPASGQEANMYEQRDYLFVLERQG